MEVAELFGGRAHRASRSLVGQILQRILEPLKYNLDTPPPTNITITHQRIKQLSWSVCSFVCLSVQCVLGTKNRKPYTAQMW